jgi:hypothetical protein
VEIFTTLLGVIDFARKSLSKERKDGEKKANKYFWGCDPDLGRRVIICSADHAGCDS